MKPRTHGLTRASAALVAIVLMAAAPAIAKPPNLLVITFDTTRADRLGCYGFEQAVTPAIDRLAREGVLFERVYAPAPQTLPSHTSIFTGLHPITHNVLSNGQRLSEEAVTLAELLKSNGYRTGAILAATPLLADFNLDQGFDLYDDDFEEYTIVRGFRSFLRLFSRSKINLPTTRPAPRVARLARKWLSTQAGDGQPFFLWLHFFEPHHPYVYRKDFDRPELIREEGELNGFGEKEANYINEIEFADHYLGKVLDHMDRLGLTDDTLTVFTADHGESLGEHDYRGHRENVYDDIIRVPLILRLPGSLEAGKRLETPASLLDVTPTILSLLQQPYATAMFQGSNLFRLSTKEPRPIFSLAVQLFTKTPIRRTMIYGDWKFIEFADTEKNALYNLREDPEELVNRLHDNRTERVDLNWREEIDNWFTRYERLDLSDFQMSPEQLERLRSLGYIQGN